MAFCGIGTDSWHTLTQVNGDHVLCHVYLLLPRASPNSFISYYIIFTFYSSLIRYKFSTKLTTLVCGECVSPLGTGVLKCIRQKYVKLNVLE